jgi:hypothetical protein
MNRDWIALIQVCMIAARNSGNDVIAALAATQALITMMGSSDLAGQQLMVAHNELADGRYPEALRAYQQAIRELALA